MLESQYRSQSKFGWDTLEAASQRLNELKAVAVLRYQTKDKTHDGATFALSDVSREVLNCLNDDLNTPSALAYLSEISTQLLTVSLEENMLGHFNDMLAALDLLLGLKLSEVPDIDDDSKSLIKKREEYRLDGKWSEADEIRDELIKRRIAIEDKPTGPQWSWLDRERPSQTVA